MSGSLSREMFAFFYKLMIGEKEGVYFFVLKKV
jgi:hypothetical protein